MERLGQIVSCVRRRLASRVSLRSITSCTEISSFRFQGMFFCLSKVALDRCVGGEELSRTGGSLLTKRQIVSITFGCNCRSASKFAHTFGG